MNRQCIACDYAHFVEHPPLSGDCRKNPPRSFLESRDSKPGRFFTSVRYDDWCGQFKESADTDRVEKARTALASFINPRAKKDLAAQWEKSGRLNDAIPLYEAAFESDQSDGNLAFQIANSYRKLHHQSPSRDAFEWFGRASDLGHPEAAFWVGLTYAQGEIVELDIEEANKHLKVSAERKFERAVKKLTNGGFTTPTREQTK